MKGFRGEGNGTSTGSSWCVDNNGTVTKAPGARGFSCGNNHWSMDYSEFQMFKEIGVDHLDTGATHGSFLNRNDAGEELDMIFKSIG